MNLALRLDDVSKRFGDTVAVDRISLDLRADQILALVGPSGCGKSTLLRLIAGLHSTDSGRIELGGTVVDDGRGSVPPEERHIGLVFQEHALFPHLTVERNVAFGLRKQPDAGQRTDQVLAMVGLDEHRRRYPHELSGGERQRVALARAIAPRPTLMLLDEPFASLDPNLRTRIRADIVEVLRAEGTPAVVVTHDQAEAMATGDQVAVMRAGRIEQIGTPYDVFHGPVNRFVAGFMGEADELPIVDGATEVGALGTAAALTGGAVALFRPDDITFAPLGDADAPSGAAVGGTVGGGIGNAVGSGDGEEPAITTATTSPAEVVGAEFRGSEWCYTLRLASGATVRSLRNHLDRLELGTMVTPSITPGHYPIVMTDRS